MRAYTQSQQKYWTVHRSVLDSQQTVFKVKSSSDAKASSCIFVRMASSVSGGAAAVAAADADCAHHVNAMRRECNYNEDRKSVV